MRLLSYQGASINTSATSVQSRRSKSSSAASVVYVYSKQLVTSSISCFRCIVPGIAPTSSTIRRKQARRPSSSISTRATNSRREGEGRRIDCLLPENWDEFDSASYRRSPSPEVEATLRDHQVMNDMISRQVPGDYVQCRSRRGSEDLDEEASHRSHSSRGHSVDMAGRVSPGSGPRDKLSEAGSSAEMLMASPLMSPDDHWQQESSMHANDVADAIGAQHAVCCSQDHSDYGNRTPYGIIDTPETMKRILSSSKKSTRVTSRCRECKIKMKKLFGGTLTETKKGRLRGKQSHFYACNECKQQFICAQCWQGRQLLQQPKQSRRRPQRDPYGNYYN